MEIILTIWLLGFPEQPWKQVHFETYDGCAQALLQVASAEYFSTPGGMVQCHVDGELKLTVQR